MLADEQHSSDHTPVMQQGDLLVACSRQWIGSLCGKTLSPWNRIWLNDDESFIQWHYAPRQWCRYQKTVNGWKKIDDLSDSPSQYTTCLYRFQLLQDIHQVI